MANEFSSLGALQELVKALPEPTRKPFLLVELQHRERALLLCGSVKDLVKFEVIAGIRSLVSSGFSVLFFVVLIGKLSELAAWIERSRSLSIPLPPPISRSMVVDLSGYMPSSTAIGWLAKLPAWNWQTAWHWTLAIVLVLALEKLISGYASWHKAHALRQTADALEQEAATIKRWIESLK
jgi:hypothetical protein